MQDPRWRTALSAAVAGRPWIVSADVLAATTGAARTLQDLGASRVLCVGAMRGSGPLPADHGFEQVLLDRPLPRDLMGAIHAAEALFADPPPELRDAVERFDPAGEARVWASILSVGERQLGRPVFGGRPASWAALEDKVVIDPIFREAGVAVAPSRVVPVAREALLAAAAELDRGQGTVWAGDARDGFHGGATGTFWVRGPDDVEPALTALAARSDRARVMPFLEGVPCSIHGWVLPDGTAVFRPCEMLVLRRAAPPWFFYAQAATTWDPPPAGRAQMRDVARRMGEKLREQVGFRGVFTVDGVMTAEGFLPTELNPRFGAALMVLGRTLPELPLILMHQASVAGVPLGGGAAELEALIVEAADGTRQCGFTAMSTRAVAESRSFGLVREGGWRLAREGEEPHADVLHGPGSTGSFLRVIVRPGHVEIGRSAAPVAAEVLGLLDRTLELGLGPLEPAREVAWTRTS